MREDMFKVIVERSRGGRARIQGMRDRLSEDGDLPIKIGVRRHVAITRRKTKWLNENLNPLERYLRKQLGRSWNAVYSEIASTLSPGHVVKEHVRLHLGDFVTEVAIGRNGEWISKGSERRRVQTMPWRQRFYVDPDDGTLKESAKLWQSLKIDDPRRRKRRDEVDPNVRVLDKTRELRRVDGIWYAFEFDQKPKYELDPLVYDHFTKVLVSIRRRHAISKRQLSRAELRAHGIENF
jgi:hypothetical protein